MTPAERAHELLVKHNHAYLLQDMRRVGIPLGKHGPVATLIHEYVQANKENA